MTIRRPSWAADADLCWEAIAKMDRRLLDLNALGLSAQGVAAAVTYYEDVPINAPQVLHRLHLLGVPRNPRKTRPGRVPQARRGSATA